jgi:hypothetical protein
MTIKIDIKIKAPSKNFNVENYAHNVALVILKDKFVKRVVIKEYKGR